MKVAQKTAAQATPLLRAPSFLSATNFIQSFALGGNPPPVPQGKPFAPLDLFSERKITPYTRCLKEMEEKPTTVRVRVNIEVRRTLRYILIYRNIKSATKKMKKLFSNTRGKNFFNFFAFSMTQPLGRWWALNEATGIRYDFYHGSL